MSATGASTDFGTEGRAAGLSGGQMKDTPRFSEASGRAADRQAARRLLKPHRHLPIAVSKRFERPAPPAQGPPPAVRFLVVLAFDELIAGSMFECHAEPGRGCRPHFPCTSSLLSRLPSLLFVSSKWPGGASPRRAPCPRACRVALLRLGRGYDHPCRGRRRPCASS